EARPLSALEVLDSFFEVAKAQNWVKTDSILAIQQDYAKLKDEFEKAKVDERQLSLVAEFVKPAEDKKTFEGKDNSAETILFDIESRTENKPLKAGSMLERQEKIMDFLKENGRVQVWQVKQVLPEVTKRTLRRDFEYMLSQGLIERMGERNDTFYQVKTN
ncbi:MAG: DeoR family transcriptional regulator, partial [bacterium]|nr:DeoR family transcriptional regulator [bacterium]